MRSVSISAERPSEVCIAGRGLIREVWIRANIREEETVVDTGQEPETGSQWVCDEAYMSLSPEDCPTVSEVQEDLEAWFDYAAAWQPAREKSLAQVQADVEYIAALTGIDLEV
jgi:hypothetical protein